MPSNSPPLSLLSRLYIAAMSYVTDFCRRRDGTINRCLMSFLDCKVRAKPNPISGVRSFDVVVNSARDLWFRLFVPVDCEASDVKIPVVVFFHGGGFAFLSAASRAYDIVCRRFAKGFNALVVSVDYRLSPEYKWPAPYVDGVDVLRWMDGNESEMMVEFNGVADRKKVFLMGDSAGGNIAHHVAKMYAEESSWNEVELAGMVLIQPYFGGEERTDSELRLVNAPLVSIERTDWLWNAFLPVGENRDHESCNVFGPRDEAELGESFPKKTMVVVGGWDPLQDWQRRYAVGLRERGKNVRLAEYEHSVHAFYMLPGATEASLLIDEIKMFMETNATEPVFRAYDSYGSVVQYGLEYPPDSEIPGVPSAGLYASYEVNIFSFSQLRLQYSALLDQSRRDCAAYQRMTLSYTHTMYELFRDHRAQSTTRIEELEAQLAGTHVSHPPDTGYADDDLSPMQEDEDDDDDDDDDGGHVSL